ncbi:MAG TPA: TIR domain-containing protein, partial [Thermoanaerobaculia bacterium]|nr:TIR domain-containing protein [Thermoanaerobaculia bacterium]
MRTGWIGVKKAPARPNTIGALSNGFPSMYAPQEEIVMPYRVFIAYSGKNSDLGDAVALRLGESLEADRWPYTFRFGEGTFEGLLQKAKQYDFGVFAFSKDDFQKVDGGRNFLAPNVVFELGV